MLREFEYGINNGIGVYFIDSNLLIALGNYYYCAQCKPPETTNEVVEFILKARKYGVYNQFPLVELCYDYNSNTLNNSMMQKIMIAYDYLITTMDEKAIRSHRGALQPESFRNKKITRTYNSIFECNLPNYMFPESDGSLRDTFYVVYLYMLKVYSLYNDRNKNSLEKIEELFLYMVNDTNLILSNEFFSACMLFIGENSEKDVIKKIIKPCINPTLDHILNATIDVFQVKMAEVFTQMSVMNRWPCFVRFATFDKGLQDYIEHVTQYNTVITRKMTSSLNIYQFNVNAKYREDWNRFYYEIIEPTLKKRLLDAHLGQKSFGSYNFNTIREEIVRLENQVLN